ncbi:MAG TPA: undecaprenyl-diphosphate phosphatase [Xanthobacteraceae bacterium]
MLTDIIKATLLGILEGLTEFVPVSSTGHLLLIGHFFGFTDDDFGKTFVVLIQLGAILAILSVYFGKLLRIALALPYDLYARRFAIGVVVAFLPAALVGYFARGFIKGTLFNPWVVCTALILGGLVLLWVDRLELAQRHRDATRFPLAMYFWIGCAQCLAMIPGVSRSGATIVSAMLLGADKRAAAEFSFFLAIPTMAGAFALDLIKSSDQLTSSNTLIVAIGFATSFVAGWFVVRGLLDYVSQHGFALFAWWRILVGALGLIGLALVG